MGVAGAVRQGESKYNDKHNDELLCVVNIITTSATNDLLHAIFYTNGTQKQKGRVDNKQNYNLMQKWKGKQGKKLILTHYYTGDKFWSRQKNAFEVLCCGLRIHKKTVK